MSRPRNNTTRSRQRRVPASKFMKETKASAGTLVAASGTTSRNRARCAHHRSAARRTGAHHWRDRAEHRKPARQVHAPDPCGAVRLDLRGEPTADQRPSARDVVARRQRVVGGPEGRHQVLEARAGRGWPHAGTAAADIRAARTPRRRITMSPSAALHGDFSAASRRSAASVRGATVPVPVAATRVGQDARHAPEDLPRRAHGRRDGDAARGTRRRGDHPRHAPRGAWRRGHRGAGARGAAADPADSRADRGAGHRAARLPQSAGGTRRRARGRAARGHARRAARLRAAAWRAANAR